MCVCVLCVRVCVRTRVRVCVCVAVVPDTSALLLQPPQMCIYIKVVRVKTRETQTCTHRDTERPRHRDTQNFYTQRVSHGVNAKTYRAKPAAAQKVAVVRIMRPFS